jgi:hypothetical protein
VGPAPCPRDFASVFFFFFFFFSVLEIEPMEANTAS